MKTIVLVTFAMCALLSPSILDAQSETATYWRDPATGMVYEYRQKTPPAPQYHPNYGDPNVINREISRGGAYSPPADIMDAQRKALEIRILEEQLHRERQRNNR